MDTQSPILVRIFKEEAEMEVWKQTRDGQYALLKTYPICQWSGDLGPKKKEGDRQAPEGFYTITPAQMNPNSNYYLAFNTGFPNAYDRAHGYSGSELMVHGDCSSRGCYAMTDEQILEIYALARESFFGGQKEFQFEAFPFRMTALNMARHRNNPNFAFWKMLKEGYDDFEATHQEPKVAVCEKRYVFDAATEDGKAAALQSERRLPARYRLDPAVASTVLDYRRQEQLKMANYISERVATVPPHVGDGGMNPVSPPSSRTRTSTTAATTWSPARPPTSDATRSRRAAARAQSARHHHPEGRRGESRARQPQPAPASEPAACQPACHDGERADADARAAAERRPGAAGGKAGQYRQPVRQSVQWLEAQRRRRRRPAQAAQAAAEQPARTGRPARHQYRNGRQAAASRERDSRRRRADFAAAQAAR